MKIYFKMLIGINTIDLKIIFDNLLYKTCFILKTEIYTYILKLLDRTSLQ